MTPTLPRRPARAALPLIFLLLAACGTGCQQVRRMSDILTGKTPKRYTLLMENEQSADARWKGMTRLVDDELARRPPYTTRYRQIAVADPDPLVRAVAIRSLNRSRDTGATDFYIQALNDPSDLVRLEGAKALINMPDPAAAAPLLALLNRPEETRDVRVAATEALKHYKQLDVARALVARLNERDFGVAWQARRSLRRMTQRDLGYNEPAWLQFITSPENPFG